MAALESWFRPLPRDEYPIEYESPDVYHRVYRIWGGGRRPVERDGTPLFRARAAQPIEEDSTY